MNLSVNTRLRGAERSAVLGSWAWLRPWLNDFANNRMASLAPILITVAALAVYALGLILFGRGKRRHGPSAWTLSPLLLTLIIWFFTFPEPKYVPGVLWSLAALSVALAFFSLDVVAWRLRLAAVLLLTCAGLAYCAFLVFQLRTFPLPAGPDDGFLCALGYEV